MNARKDITDNQLTIRNGFTNSALIYPCIFRYIYEPVNQNFQKDTPSLRPKMPIPSIPKTETISTTIIICSIVMFMLSVAHWIAFPTGNTLMWLTTKQ